MALSLIVIILLYFGNSSVLVASYWAYMPVLAACRLILSLYLQLCCIVFLFTLWQIKFSLFFCVLLTSYRFFEDGHSVGNLLPVACFVAALV